MEELQGYFLYDGIHTTQQVSNIKSFFEFLLKEERFDTIIEIGTSLAGLTYILDDIIKDNNLPHNIHTFDFSYKDYVDNFLKERECNYHICDERTDEFKTKIKDLLMTGGKCLLLCDGGNKKEEFNLYSDFLKKGDIIMAHDYSLNQEFFNEKINNKIWNWFEIEYKDIEDSVIRNKLSEYSKLNFLFAAWACYEKH